MNPWKCTEWQDFYKERSALKTGLRLHFDKNVNRTVRSLFIDLAAWLRCSCSFPIRVNVYIKSSEAIKAADGDKVSATFFGPFDRLSEPYIRIATGDIEDLTHKAGIFSALCSEAASMIHELTHYYQWLNALELTEKQKERQALYYCEKIMYQYLDSRGYDFLCSMGIEC